MDSLNRYIKDEYLGSIATSNLMAITVFSVLVRKLDLQTYMSANSTEIWYQSNLKDISFALLDYEKIHGEISERQGRKIVFIKLLRNLKANYTENLNSKIMEVVFDDLHLNLKYLNDNQKLPNFTLFKPETIEFLKSLDF